MTGLRGLVGLLLTSVVIATAAPADAVQAPHPAVVDAVPATATPAVRDGSVNAILQVGDRMVLAGTFTQASSAGSNTVLTRKRILSFDPVTGVIDGAFAPDLGDYVETLLPGPTPTTVYAGGKFNDVNGQPRKGVVLLDLTTGATVGSFAPPYLNGIVEDMALRNGQLLIAGTFTTIGNSFRGGLASVDPTTGAVTDYLTASVTEHHNYNGTGVEGAVGVTRFDITPDGTRMILIGNFRKVDGQERRQIAMLDLTGPTAVLATDWITNRFASPCRADLIDSWVRDIDISPDGSYFVVVGKGGFGADTLCDGASRWETAARGTDLQPTWIALTGGDTLLTVAITGAAVYVGGHQRWLNNALGANVPKPGAVPRPGLAALDPASGVPLSWNPGRNPRGIGTSALYATPAGLWMGSDTEYIGNFRYYRPRLAFFPLTAQNLPDYSVPTLPADVYFGGPLSASLGRGTPALQPDDLARRFFDGSAPGTVNTLAAGARAWSQVRGAVLLGSTLFYGYSDGMLYRRSFDGSTLGPAQAIDPYNDPAWVDAKTGKPGQTYRGVRPSFYDEIADITGMVVQDGRLYYTLNGDGNLYWRLWSPDSGTIHPVRNTVAGPLIGPAAGLILSGDQLYVVKSTNGALRRWTLTGSGLSGRGRTVSGPRIDGADWRAHALFTGP